MNSFLIHNDNLPLEVLNFFGSNQLKFDIQSSHVIQYDFTFDNYASKELELALKGRDFKVIYIVLNLNKNDYLEFTALSLVNHIRLTENWNHSHVPIVIFSPLSTEEISRISDDYDVLYTPGVFIQTVYSTQAIKQMQSVIKNSFRVENRNMLTYGDYQKYIKTIRIHPPGHFDSQHSIDNELTLYHWSKAIGIENIEIEKEIETGLYFKYYNVLNPIKPLNVYESKDTHKQNNSKPSSEINSNLQSFNGGRVLLIDDQWRKGWEKLFKGLVNLPNIRFDKILIEKGMSFNLIQSLTEDKIKTFKPHLILLDLRLIDDDFKPGIEIEKVSGFQLLNFIQAEHPAIQIIITTASTKASTYAATMNYAFSFVQKSTTSDTEIVLKRFQDDIKDGINLAQNLINYHNVVKKIEKNITHLQQKTITQIIHNLRISSELLLKAGKSKRMVFQSYAFLQLFHILESYIRDSSVYLMENDSFFVIKNEFKYLTVCRIKEQIEIDDEIKYKNNSQHWRRAVKDGCREIDEQFNLSNNYHTLNNKVIEILIFRNGLTDISNKKWKGKNWYKLNSLRNDFAHGKNSIDIDLESIQALIEFISYLTDDKNLTSLDLIEFDLSEKSLDDKLNALKNKFS